MKERDLALLRRELQRHLDRFVLLQPGEHPVVRDLEDGEAPRRVLVRLGQRERELANPFADAPTGKRQGENDNATVSWLPDEEQREPLRVTFETAADRY